MIGIIRMLKADKRFGFIKTSEGIEFFFHKDDFRGHWDDLVFDFNDRQEDINVEFEVGEGPKGPRANNVKRLDYPNQSVAE